MFTIYSKHKAGSNWLCDGTYDTATEAIQTARLLAKYGYLVEIDDGTNIEKDSPYND